MFNPSNESITDSNGGVDVDVRVDIDVDGNAFVGGDVGSLVVNDERGLATVILLLLLLLLLFWTTPSSLLILLLRWRLDGETDSSFSSFFSSFSFSLVSLRSSLVSFFFLACFAKEGVKEKEADFNIAG